jgi:lipopolysaccharide transport system ATP-binding protein
MGAVIKVENLSKQYRLGLVGSGTFKEDTKRWWAKMRGKEDPYAHLGEENNRTVASTSNFVWSLKDINFEVQQGDVLGIVGRNGAGKSTLLKILSKVTSPTTGSIKAKGRIASLLEVGTGFHPELTGRENIFLNGAILGMRRHEIKSKLDEIIAFAGVERYIDTPVKRYSSGMYVRLAFAVAAHLENEILIIDEVLAVGDAEFQKKCLGKMGEVSKSEGRTVLFVSHNVVAVKELCNRGLLLSNGNVIMDSTSRNVIDEYLMKPISISSENDLLNDPSTRRGHGEVRMTSVSINNGQKELDPCKKTVVNLKLKVLKSVEELCVTISFKGNNNEVVASTELVKVDSNLSLGENVEYDFVFPENTFKTGLFPMYLWIGKRGTIDHYHYDVIDSLFYLNFTSDKNELELGYDSINPQGYLNLNFNIQKIN